MARGVQLSQLIRDVRAEVGRSLDVAHGVNDRDALIHHINRVQRTLAMAHDFEHLHVRRNVALGAGTRYYAFPSELDFEQVQETWVDYGSTKLSVDYGVGADEMAAYDSDADERSWPVRRWMVDADNPSQFEVWPIPDQAGTLNMYGRRVITDMVADSDTSILDGDLITLNVAGEILARNKAEDATQRLNLANALLNRILARQRAHKRSSVLVLGGGLRRSRTLRPGIDYIP